MAYRASNVEKLRAKKADYRATNGEKINEALRRHYFENHTKQLMKQAAYRVEHREEIRERARDRYRANPFNARAHSVRYYAANQIKKMAYQRAYAAAHPDQSREHKARRRAARLRAPSERVKLAIVYDRDNGRCGICHRAVTRVDASLDHIVPLSLGGHHMYTNVQLAHLVCNLRRGVGRIPAQERLL